MGRQGSQLLLQQQWCCDGRQCFLCDVSGDLDDPHSMKAEGLDQNTGPRESSLYLIQKQFIRIIHLVICINTHVQSYMISISFTHCNIQSI